MPHSCCQSFLPLFFLPWLSGASGGEGGGGEGEQWGAGKVTEGRGKREEKRVQETKGISSTKHFVPLMLLCSDGSFLLISPPVFKSVYLPE